MKERLDVLLVQEGYAASREKAKAIIMAGLCFVDGQREDKAGTTFDPSKIKLEVRGSTLPYVSRGGLKLEKAIRQFGLLLSDKICMDIGASTGGFTDCMLQNGAKKVYSVDVGHGQLDWKLRNDNRAVDIVHGADDIDIFRNIELFAGVRVQIGILRGDLSGFTAITGIYCKEQFTENL